MANPDLKRDALLKSKLVPGVVARRQRRAADAQALADAYADVDFRDCGYCWVTGRYTQSVAVDARVRREHHHLVQRSLSQALRADPSNIITVCAEAHALITAGWIAVEGEDARMPLRFHWTELAKGKRPFELRSRRQSQEL